MRKRRTADEVARLLRDADRDLAKGLTVSDVCRKIGVAQTTWRIEPGRKSERDVDCAGEPIDLGTLGEERQPRPPALAEDVQPRRDQNAVFVGQWNQIAGL